MNKNSKITASEIQPGQTIKVGNAYRIVTSVTTTSFGSTNLFLEPVAGLKNVVTRKATAKVEVAS